VSHQPPTNLAQPWRRSSPCWKSTFLVADRLPTGLIGSSRRSVRKSSVWKGTPSGETCATVRKQHSSDRRAGALTMFEQLVGACQKSLMSTASASCLATSPTLHSSTAQVNFVKLLGPWLPDRSSSRSCWRCSRTHRIAMHPYR
jgi:hypothetical protein